MLRCVLLGVILSTSAIAAPLGQAELENYQDVRMMCRQGEDKNGPISRAASDTACAELDKLGTGLKERGYCWDNGEQTWFGCGLMN